MFGVRRRLLAILMVLVAINLAACRSGATTTAESGGSEKSTLTTQQNPAAPPMTTSPTTTVSQGDALPDITQPPAETLAMLDAKSAQKDSRYDIVFEPFGYGPRGPGGREYVIKVISSTPEKGVKKAFEFEGRNVLASADDDTGDAPKVGGTYRAVLTLREQGALLMPVLSDIESE